MTQDYSAAEMIFDFADDEGETRRVSFKHPLEIIVAHSIDEVVPALDAVQRATDGGRYAAGYVAYEAAPAFDPALIVRRDATSLPLLWFGIFDAPAANNSAPQQGDFQLSKWTPSISRQAYDDNIRRVRTAIARGDTYQANYTMRLRANFAGDALAFYEQLRRAQPKGYGAYLDTGRYRILSASPELFFRREVSSLTTRPMKGTTARGRFDEEDATLSDLLFHSEKNRAENVMIVDLLRNDLGRIAEIGTVAVSHLFEIERHPTVFQMTSTVSAKIASGQTLSEILRALFPCGSVTGAPKISTMKIISALEDSPRNIYCGAIGMIAPGNRAIFNVAIRTVLIDQQMGVAEYGVGGGITWDSTAEDEYAEALTKARLLTLEHPSFELLETLRLENGTYSLLESHLARLASSANYFDILLSIASVRATLDEHADRFPTATRRVRLLVAKDGATRIESQPLESLTAEPLPVALAQAPISKHDRFLYHKTTHRRVYEQHRKLAQNAFDVLLWNEDNVLTEFTNGNLVLEIDGRRWTPPRDCGLLAGTFRAQLLEAGEVCERVLTRDDLRRASRCWFVNSVRGWVVVAFA